MNSILQVYCWEYQWKNFEQWAVFVKYQISSSLFRRTCFELCIFFFVWHYRRIGATVGCFQCLCVVCPDSYFQCPNTGRCLPPTYRCNGYDNCGDLSDELNCSKWYIPLTFKHWYWKNKHSKTCTDNKKNHCKWQTRTERLQRTTKNHPNQHMQYDKNWDKPICFKTALNLASVEKSVYHTPGKKW